MSSPDLVLLGDIGGTNSRFGVVAAGEIAPRDIIALQNDGLSGLGAAIASYVETTGNKPARAVLAVAGPIKAGQVHLTNRRDWAFSPEELARGCGLSAAKVVNDFVALAEALPYLGDEFEPLGAAQPRPDATKAAFGPGTGLGVAGLLRDGDRWVVVPSEAGHCEFAATTQREAEIYRVLRTAFGRISAELVVSGEGLERLDMAIAEVDGQAATAREGRAISDAARKGETRAGEVMDLFFDALGRFAGDIALTFVARGGIYIGGGVLPKVVDLMDVARFRQNFEAKRPHGKLVAEMATVLITAQTPALTGCAAIAARG